MPKRLGAFIAHLSLPLLLLIALSGPSVPQSQDPATQTQRPRKVFPKEQEAEDVVRVDTDLVSVDVTAIDANGRPVRNLRQEDFKVYSDDVEQPISFFQIEKREGELRPLAIVFALDVSGSMTSEEIIRLRAALQSFSNHLASHPVVYAVTTFGMTVKRIQKFTSHPDKLDDSLGRIAKDAPSGLSTHTYDAVDDAIRMLVRSAPRTREKRLMKRAVLVVTDGFPVGDTVSPKTVIERICGHAAVILARDRVVGPDTTADSARREWISGANRWPKCLCQRKRLCAAVSRFGRRGKLRVRVGLLSTRGKETRWEITHHQG
jgi:Mg-chelatase subunit ChlD